VLTARRRGAAVAAAGAHEQCHLLQVPACIDCILQDCVYMVALCDILSEGCQHHCWRIQRCFGVSTSPWSSALKWTHQAALVSALFGDQLPRCTGL
jgi:hypothetical protein